MEVSSPDVLRLADYVYVIGPPGAGKGTLCGRLANGSNVVHISVGDRCRDAAKEPTDLGREIQGYMEKKELLPTRLIIKLLGDLIEKEFIGGGRQFLLDGFPRSADQAMLLKTHFETNRGVVSFECSENVTVPRIIERSKTSNRPDDTEEVGRTRYRDWASKKDDLLGVFRREGLEVFAMDTEGETDSNYEIFAEKVKNWFGLNHQK
ncbi:hypothetical protein MMC20_005585 [Loxospora ochrophaea]|nr:hypothetical protein [Loxospora ochrophaea]